MTADDPAQPNPQMLASVACGACSTAYVATRDAGSPVPLTAQAGTWATRDGWVHHAATGWRCPRCRARYGDRGGPRRFTVREAWRRRVRAT